MKYVWEPSDFNSDQRRLGTIVQHKGKDGEKWLLSYSVIDDPAHFLMVSLRDGMLTRMYAAVEFAKMLNEEGYLPIVTLERVPT